MIWRGIRLRSKKPIQFQKVFFSVFLSFLCAFFLVTKDASAGGGKGHDYVISINYELGMHCTGFDFSYCCVLPPYNSILTQVVRHGRMDSGGALPQVLGSDPNDNSILVDGDKRFKLHYEHVGNSYSEGNKMAYWNVPFDIDGDGNPFEPGESVANAVFRHLYVYKDLEGSNPSGTSKDSEKLHVGIGPLQIPLDSGPTGQPVSNSYLKYSGEKGTIVFTKGPVLDNVPIVLTNPGIWEALGLPLTGFYDADAVKGMLKLGDKDIQPYQEARVTLVDAATGKAVIDSTGKPVSFTGTNPIDVPNCYNCHSNENANGVKFNKYKGELEYWKSVGASDWIAELKATAISILEIHDTYHGTDFLKSYNPKATSNRLGRSPVICQECHADNVIGVLNSKTVDKKIAPNAAADKMGKTISPLTEAIHSRHQRLRPLPDSKGRTGACQACHPAHRYDRSMAGYPITPKGENAFAKSDNRDAAGGCYVGRDVHSNPAKDKDGAGTPEHLNAIGEYLKKNVSREGGEMKGLWCTNCHNQLTRELYERDNLTNAFAQTGETIRNKSLDQIAKAIGVSRQELIDRYIDPRVPLKGEDADSGVRLTWAQKRLVPSIAVIEVKDGGPVVSKDEDGDVSVHILSANPGDAPKHKNGAAVPYEAATHGRDYWLSPGAPHCADCHKPPFVEGQGGVAFPINQPGKYSLMRYTKGHAGLSCQFCHESIHGLYPVTSSVDVTTYNQAAMMNPDGSHGPVKCAACHVVNSNGVPKLAEDREWEGKKIGKDYDAAVTYMHSIAHDMGGAIP